MIYSVLCVVCVQNLLHLHMSESESRSVVSNSLQTDCPDQSTGVGSLAFLQGIFPTQGSNPGLLHCRRILYQLSHQGSPAVAAKSLQSCPTLCDPVDVSPPGSSVPGILQARILEWVAISLLIFKFL